MDRKVKRGRRGAYRFRCPSAFVCRDLLDRALDFYEIHILISELNDALENGLYLHAQVC